MRFARASIVLAIVIIVVNAALARCEPLVGAFYYPWYGDFPGAHDWSQTLRQQLTPAQQPSLGLYSSRDAAVISQQIDDSHRGNVDLWAVSWWGPQSVEDATLRDAILENPRSSELKYAINYESSGRLGTAAAPDYTNLLPDFRYLAGHYFDDARFLRIDDRPVVFMYLTLDYFKTQDGRDALAALRTTIMAEYGVNPYIVADDISYGLFDLQHASLFDAVTAFDAYGTSLRFGGNTTAALDHLASVYDDAKAGLAGTDVAIVPTASPGFNDTAVRDGHVPAPRVMTDDPNSQEGDLFRHMLADVAVPRTDPRALNLLMINSFNEWHEDTQIEPTKIVAATSQDASADNHFAQGNSYPGYGDLYLDILHQATVPEPSTATLAALGGAAWLVFALRRLRGFPAAGWLRTRFSGRTSG